MPWLFVITLAIALVVTYILTNSADEIAYLAACILLVSLVLSLIFAPWQIQLMLLILVLFSNQRLSPPQSPSVEYGEERQNNDKQEMAKLSYRGVNYSEPIPPAVEMSEGEIIGKYRGQVCRLPQVKDAVALQPTGEIKYRGASVSQQESLTPVAKETSV